MRLSVYVFTGSREVETDRLADRDKYEEHKELINCFKFHRIHNHQHSMQPVNEDNIPTGVARGSAGMMELKNARKYQEKAHSFF